MINYHLIRILINIIMVMLTVTSIIYKYDASETTSKPSLPEVINLETIFCRIPQSYSKSEQNRCSSARQLFLTLKNDCTKEYNKIKSEDTPSWNKTMASEVNTATVERKTSDPDKAEEKPSSFVDLLMVTLLVVSAFVSIVELCRERSRRNQIDAGGGTPGEGKPGVRRMSLVNLTVSRHARKKECQTGVRPPPLLRRLSLSQLPEPASSRRQPIRQQSWCANLPGPIPSRKLSAELSEDDSSPDRKRVRIIRRH